MTASGRIDRVRAAAATWPASQVLSPDALRGAVSDDFSVELTVLSTS
ncbi:hypothetical protein ACLIYP_00680 [Streptomyces nanhaiensis]